MFSSCTENIKPVEDPKSVELKYSEADKDTMLVLVVDHTIMVFDQNNQQVYHVDQLNEDDISFYMFMSTIITIVLFLIILASLTH